MGLPSIGDVLATGRLSGILQVFGVKLWHEKIVGKRCGRSSMEGHVGFHFAQRICLTKQLLE